MFAFVYNMEITLITFFVSTFLLYIKLQSREGKEERGYVIARL